MDYVNRRLFGEGFKAGPYSLILRQPCSQVIHPWHPQSHIIAFLVAFKDAFAFGFKINLPPYLVALALSRAPLTTLFRLLRSTLSLALTGALCVPTGCVWRQVFGGNYPLNPFLSGLVAGLAGAAVEAPPRRRELALFLGNQGVEALCRILASRGLLPYVKRLDLYLYFAGSWLLALRLMNEPATVSSVLKPVFLGRHPVSTPDSKHKRHLRIAIPALSVGGGGLVLLLSRLTGKALPVQRVIDYSLAVCATATSWHALTCVTPHRLPLSAVAPALALANTLVLAFARIRNTSLAVYLLAKVVQSYHTKGRREGWIPAIPYGHTLLYSATCGLVVYCASLEPYNLRPAYLQFVLNLSGGRFKYFQPAVEAYRPDLLTKIGVSYRRTKT